MSSIKIIAEFCQNHNGDESILRRMIDEAARNGATHGKIQTIFADDLSFRPEFEEGRTEGDKIITIKRPYQPEYDRLKKLELSYKQQAEFVKNCQAAGMIPLTTAFTRGSVQKIREAGFRSIKIASYDCGSVPLIRDAAQAFDEVIVSTGATLDTEIEAAAQALKASGKPYAFLHCVTIYPTPLSLMNLKRMEFLQKFSKEVGLSEHSLAARDGVKACLAAIYLGATWLERHFTVLGPTESRDGPVSINGTQLKEIADFAKLDRGSQKQFIEKNIPEFNAMLGSETRQLSDEEMRNRAYYRGRFATHVGSGNDRRPQYNWEGA